MLRQRGVIQWIFGDLSFLGCMTEEAWGRAILRERFSDLACDGAWIDKFGEYLCEEILLLANARVVAPRVLAGLQVRPDMETERALIVARTCAYGRHNCDKLLASPLKYSSLPRALGKPLEIICIGDAESALCNFATSHEGAIIIDFFVHRGISFVRASSILASIPP